MRAFLIAPNSSLIDGVASHLEGMNRDYSSSLVVFPGKRPAHFLRKVLAKKERCSFVPPRTFSMDEFIDHLYGDRMGLDGKRLEAIDAVSLLYDIQRGSMDRLGAEDFLAPDAFFALGMKIFHDIEELCIEGVEPAAVREIDALAEEKIPAPMAKRLQTLSHFYETFYKMADERRYSTRSSRYRAVAEALKRTMDDGRRTIDEKTRNVKTDERIEIVPFGKIIFAGFFALTEMEKRIFRAFMQKENVILLFQDGQGMEERLSDMGISVELNDERWTIDDGQKNGSPPGPEIHCYKSPDGHGQVFGVGTLLKEKIDRGQHLDEKTVIVLPSPDALFPLYHQALSLLPMDGYNISLGYPLQRTPIFSFFRSLMELAVSMEGDRLYVPYYLKFILHPYTKNIYFRERADLTRMLFHAVEECLTVQKRRKFLSLYEIEEDESVSELIIEKILDGEPGITLKMMKEHLRAIHLNTIGRMKSFENVSHFADELKRVMEYIYKESTASLHPFFYPYAQSFVSHLDLLSRSLMREIKFERTGSYFNLFKKYLATGHTPFLGTPLQGVQILGFLETRNLKFEEVFFLDANEGVVPETRREDSLLPVRARTLLRLPTHQDRERLMAHYFDVLIQGARKVHLFYVENDEKERSRFVERLLWEKQKKERRTDDRGYVKTIQYAVTLKEKNPRPVEKSEEMIRFLREYSFSASSLDNYLSCPLKFYYERVLGLREKEAVSEEIEGEEIGSFVHEVLFDYFKGRVGRFLSERDIDPDEMEKTVHHRFAEHYGADPTGEAYLLKRQMEKHLKDFLRDYQMPKCREGSVRILGLEQRLDVSRNSFKLNARLDRVEERKGKTTIIDYKTSGAKTYLSINFNRLDFGNRTSWSEAIPTVQLPFYLITYSTATGKKAEDMESLFLLVGRSMIDSSIELPLFRDGSESAEQFKMLHEVIFGLLREIVDKGKPFVPTVSLKDHCPYCPYRDLCSQ